MSLVKCSKDETCPLCRAGFKASNQIVLTDAVTGAKILCSPELSEKIRAVLDKIPTKPVENIPAIGKQSELPRTSDKTGNVS